MAVFFINEENNTIFTFLGALSEGSTTKHVWVALNVSHLSFLWEATPMLGNHLAGFESQSHMALGQKAYLVSFPSQKKINFLVLVIFSRENQPKKV